VDERWARNWQFRIETTWLSPKTAAGVLTKGVPKTIDEIEALNGRAERDGKR